MKLILMISCFLPATFLKSQDTSMLKILEDSLTVHRHENPAQGTFEGVYLINSQTVETPPRHTLLLIIMHRFGQLNQGAYNFFGLDFATMRLGFDYGISRKFSIAIGRSTLEKTFDSHLKWKLFQQTDGTGHMPFTIDIFEGIYYTTLRSNDSVDLTAKQRTSFASSLLIAKKFSNSLSLQLTPTWIHYNLVPSLKDHNNVFNFCVGGRIKITRRMGLQAEYNYVPQGQINSYKRYNSLSLGIDIVTGGHVFELQLSNSQAMTEPSFIGKTTDSWRRGGIFFGFNISRAFQMGK